MIPDQELAPRPQRQRPMAVAAVVPCHCHPRISGRPMSISTLVPNAQAKRQAVSTDISTPRLPCSISVSVLRFSPARYARSSCVQSRNCRQWRIRPPIGPRAGVAAVLRPACCQQGARPAAQRGVGEGVRKRGGQPGAGRR